MANIIFIWEEEKPEKKLGKREKLTCRDWMDLPSCSLTTPALAWSPLLFNKGDRISPTCKSWVEETGNILVEGKE